MCFICIIFNWQSLYAICFHFFSNTVLWLLFKVVKDDNEVVLFSYIYIFSAMSHKLPSDFQSFLKNTHLFNSCIQIGIQSNFYSSIKCWSLVQMWSTLHQYFTSTYFYSNIYWEANILTYNLIYKLLLSIKNIAALPVKTKKCK